MKLPQEYRQLIISVFFLLLSWGTKVIHPVKTANEIKRFFFYLNTYGFCLPYWSPQGLQMPVAKLYTGRCTQGKAVLMQRGKHNKWRTEFASKRKKTTSTKSKNTKTKKNSLFFCPSECCDLPIKYTLRLQKKEKNKRKEKKKENVTLVFCKK